MKKVQDNKPQNVVVGYDTKISVVEKKYGVDLGVSPDKDLGTFLKEKGYGSLSEMLKKA
jgi:hypothetical protein